MKKLLVPALMLLSAIPILGGIARLYDLLSLGGGTLDGHARFAADPVPAVLHIVGLTSFGTIGALQFAPRLRKFWWHRMAGRVLAPLGIIGATAGLWMVWRWPMKEYDSFGLNVFRVTVALAIIVFIVLSLVAVRERDFKAHERWMTRAYSLIVAAGTQVFTLLPFILIPSIRSPFSQAVMMAAGWILSLAVAEWSLRRRSPRVVASPVAGTVRALRHEAYGAPSQLRIGDVPRVAPGVGQVRVKVRAASVNAMDYRIVRADPFLVRLQFGLLRPRSPRLGADLSGVVESVGEGVLGFAVGDEVFGEVLLKDGLGAFADEVVVSERAIIRKPVNLGFVDSAALPLASITALQAVRDRAKVQPGQSVLVQGAGGGVGTFLIQVAKAYGAHVTAVCGPGSVALVRSLGADEVIDYSQQDFSAQGGHYDAIFGVNGFRSLATYRRHLKPGGTYVMVGGTGRQLFGALLFGKLAFAGSGRRIEVLTIDDSLRSRDLTEVASLVTGGRLRVAIDRVFPFARAIEALEYVERGHVRGKVVMEMGG